MIKIIVCSIVLHFIAFEEKVQTFLKKGLGNYCSCK